MGSTIKGITVQIGGDTVNLNKALKGVDNISKNLQKELNLVNKELKFNPDNAVLLAQKQEILTDKINATREKLQKLNEVQEQVERQAKSGDLGADEYRAYQREVETTKSKLEHLESELGKTNDKFSEVQRKSGEITFSNAENKIDHLKGKFKDLSDDAIKKMDEVSKKATAIGDGIEKVSAPLNIASGAAVAGIGAGIKFASDFEDAIAKVNTIADTSQKPIEDLRKEILELSNETGVDSVTIAQNVYDAISAGQDTADAVNFVRNSVALSKAGFADAGAALDVLTTIMNAYGMESKEVNSVSDMLIQTQNLGKVTVGELASSMGKVIPTAKSYGVQLDQLAAAYSITTANGIASAESTTYINSMLNELGKSGTKSSNALKELSGKSFTELMNKGASLSDVLAILKESADKQNKSLGDMFGSAEAAKAATTLLGDSASIFNNRLKEMNGATGATGTALEKLETSSSKTKKMLNELKNDGIELGAEALKELQPLLNDGKNAIKGITEWIKKLNPQQKQALIHALEIVAVAGPAVTLAGKAAKGIGGIAGIIPKAVNAIKGMTSATKAAEAAQIGLNTAQSASPVGALVALLGLVAAAVTTYYLTTDEAAEKALFLSEAEAELYTRIDENINKWNELKDTRAAASKEVESQYGYYEELTERLKSITDESGKIKQGYEDEADVIINTLNDAFGKEYRITEGVIQNYQSMQSELSKLIQLQKAKAQQEVFEDSYKEAITNRTQAWKDISQSEKDIQSIQEKILNLREKRQRMSTGHWEQTTTGRKWVSDPKKQLEYDGLLVTISSYESNLAKAKDKLKSQQDTYLEYINTIQNYEDVTAAIASNDSEKIETALNKMTNSFLTANNATKEMLEEQLSNAETNFESIKTAFESKAPGITQSMINNASELVRLSKAELDKMPNNASSAAQAAAQSLRNENENLNKAGEELGSNAAEGFSSKLSATEVMDKVKTGVFKIGNALKEAFRTVLDMHSPSRVTGNFGENAGFSFAGGIGRTFKTVKKTIKRLRGIVDDTLGEESYEAQINFNAASTSKLSSYRNGLSNTLNSLNKLKSSGIAQKSASVNNINNSSSKSINGGINVTINNAKLDTDADIERFSEQLADTIIRKGMEWG